MPSDGFGKGFGTGFGSRKGLVKSGTFTDLKQNAQQVYMTAAQQRVDQEELDAHNVQAKVSTELNICCFHYHRNNLKFGVVLVNGFRGCHFLKVERCMPIFDNNHFIT